VWETKDPNGRRVVLEWPRLRHIRASHRDLDVTPQTLIEIVCAPDERHPGHDPGEEWFYGEGRGGPSRFVKVVVHYEGVHGRIVTAFPRRSFP
jgi:hypothetical protein